MEFDRIATSIVRAPATPAFFGCTIVREPFEAIESVLRRFKKATQKTGVLAEARKYEHYEKPSVRRRRKAAAARRRRSREAA